jgi:methyl-accepting chemotaxis protein
MNFKARLKSLRFKNLNIGSKYTVAVVVAAFLFLISTLIIFSLLSSLKTDIHSLENKGDNAIAITELISLLKTRDSLFSDYMIHKEDWILDRFKEEEAAFEKKKDEIEDRLATNEFKDEFAQILEKEDEINQIFFDGFVPAVQDDQAWKYERERKRAMKTRDEAIMLLSGIRKALNSKRTVAIQNSNSRIDFTQLVLIIAIIVSICSGVLVVYLISKQVKKNLDEVIYVSKEIATGNLTIDKLDYDGDDEIGELTTAINTMMEQLQTVITDIKEDSEILLSHSENLSASAEEGTATTESTNHLIENILSSIEKISASTQEVTGFAQEASAKTEIGSENIEETLSSIKQISQSTTETATIINQMSETSQEIDNMVGRIDDIAEQTNLLALNAAIEAARAGEAGQGFAVVAEEIRELATETNDVTQEIVSLIEKIESKINSGLSAIDKVDTKATQGKEIAQETNEVFQEIEKASDQTARQIEETASTTQDLAKNSEQVMTSTDDMKAMSNEITDSSQELAEMAQNLKGLVDQFKA